MRREKTKIPTENEKLEEKMRKIETLIEEYRIAKEERKRKMTKKQEEWKQKHKMIMVEDTWAMMRWLTQFIEENKHEWERRREREMVETNTDFDKYTKA